MSGCVCASSAVLLTCCIKLIRPRHPLICPLPPSEFDLYREKQQWFESLKLCVCVWDISDEDLTSSDMALKGMEPTTQEAPDSKLSLFYGYGAKGVHSALLEIKPPA